MLEAWRSKSTTPAASPKKAAGLSPPPSPPLPWSLGRRECAAGQAAVGIKWSVPVGAYGEWHAIATQAAHTLCLPVACAILTAASELDEYENDDDPGYQRMDVVGQEAALGRESTLQGHPSDGQPFVRHALPR